MLEEGQPKWLPHSKMKRTFRRKKKEDGREGKKKEGKTRKGGGD